MEVQQTEELPRFYIPSQHSSIIDVMTMNDKCIAFVDVER